MKRAPATAGERGSGARDLLLVAGLTALSLLPFSGKALAVDDPLFVWAARQIAADPLDPYGFEVNWYGTSLPMSEVTKNPPLASYYLAAVGAVFGWSEVALHLALLLPAVAAACGTSLLARRFSAPPLVAALSTVFTPVFLVSASTVMCDVTLLALWVWSLVLWDRGLRHGSRASLAGGSLLAACAALTKYFGMALIPLLALDALLRRRRSVRDLSFLLIPILVLAGYQLATELAYGRGLLSDAAAYATERQAEGAREYVGRLLSGLSFSGGCVASLLFLAPLLCGRRLAAAALLFGLGLLGMLSTGWVRSTLPLAETTEPTAALQIAVWTIVGLGLLLLAGADVRRRGDRDSWLLLSWVVGTFVFAALVNWTINGRSVLPLVPAAGILAARRIEDRGGGGRGRAWLLGGGLAAAAALALVATWADHRLAGSSREAASRIAGSFGAAEGTLWYQGHWGFQYYADLAGLEAVDPRVSRVRPGDHVVLPLNNTNVFGMPPDTTALVQNVAVPVPGWVGTMAPEVAAGFYTGTWGPLPLGFGSIPPHVYAVHLVTRDVRFPQPGG